MFTQKSVNFNSPVSSNLPLSMAGLHVQLLTIALYQNNVVKYRRICLTYETEFVFSGTQGLRQHTRDTESDVSCLQTSLTRSSDKQEK